MFHDVKVVLHAQRVDQDPEDGDGTERGQNGVSSSQSSGCRCLQWLDILLLVFCLIRGIDMDCSNARGKG